MCEQLSLNFDEEFKIKTEIKATKIVKYDIFIQIDGVKFEIFNLYNTLENVKNDTVAITNIEMGEFLKKIKVLKSLGSCKGGYGAIPGPRFDELFEIIENVIETANIRKEIILEENINEKRLY